MAVLLGANDEGKEMAEAGRNLHVGLGLLEKKRNHPRVSRCGKNAEVGGGGGGGMPHARDGAEKMAAGINCGHVI